MCLIASEHWLTYNCLAKFSLVVDRVDGMNHACQLTKLTCAFNTVSAFQRGDSPPIQTSMFHHTPMFSWCDAPCVTAVLYDVTPVERTLVPEHGAGSSREVG